MTFNERELQILFECVQTEREAQESAIKDDILIEAGDKTYQQELYDLEQKIKGIAA